MKPTTKLRWKVLPGSAQRAQPILQQWWEPEGTKEIAALDGEWREVPFEAAP